MAEWMVGVDTGGTFTDLVAFEPMTGELRTIKVPSVPADPSSAVINALDELFRNGLAPREIGFLVHGTTVATNAVLESAGVRAGLLITRGFRAVYEARGWVRPDPIELLDTFFRKPPLLVPQSRTEEIPERMDYRGTVLEPLDEQAVRAAARRLKARGVQAVAVCYLFSFRNPLHEERTAEILAEEEPAWRISLSSRVLPVIREYPRLSTTVVDAYVGPIMERYLVNLDRRLKDHGITTPQVFLMQSNGGLMRITMGARFPNQTLTSGPAAGVVAGAALARGTGRRNFVTLDIGGTSTDISVIADARASETSSGRIAGQDIGTPMLAVHTLGAGGGTVAWIGRDGLMKVGPQSAGAVPGPACYGRGGTAPTVTDANLILGALGTKSVLGGRMALDRRRAEQAIMDVVARPLGLDLVTAAAGIVKIVNTNMAVDLRLAFQSRGEDPRRFALLAFGGAGPLHAAYLARDLGIPEVVVPLHPGLTSAMGLLQTDVRHLYLRSAVGLLSSYPVDEINAILAELRRRATDDVSEEGLDVTQLRLKQQIDLRYLHQGYHLTVDGPDGEITQTHKQPIKAAFDDLHRRTYGASAPEEDAELVTLRVVSEVPVPHLRLPRIAAGRVADARIGERPLYDLTSAEFANAYVYDRARLGAHDRIAGPAIVEQYDSTTVVLADQALTVDDFGNLLITEEAR
ncbi:MAG TPA: hydantoinase/oxoprolinase family protein [Xanthobacteraceae bacterium]|nr:hydantoinase/oxoprolinase family protein [Xanthobacteraceae bacterium]